jgi:hypothetical protein
MASPASTNPWHGRDSGLRVELVGQDLCTLAGRCALRQPSVLQALSAGFELSYWRARSRRPAVWRAWSSALVLGSRVFSIRRGTKPRLPSP